MIKLIPVQDVKQRHRLLFDLLSERNKNQSISHHEMPRFEDHVEFVDSEPYLAWYFILDEHEDMIVGSIYLTQQREIGISIFSMFRGHGYATGAIKKVMKDHPGRFVANINPRNLASVRLFNQFNSKLIQHTYEVSL